MALNALQLANLTSGEDETIPAVRPDATATNRPDPVRDKLAAKDAASRKSLGRTASAFYGSDLHDREPGLATTGINRQWTQALSHGHNETPEQREQTDTGIGNLQHVDELAKANAAALVAYLKASAHR